MATNSWFDAFDPTTTAPRDGYGHGTATMSIIVGGDAGGTAIGVAPGAQWIAARVFDDQGDATTSTLHQGFQWVLDPDGDPATDDAPDVVNNSWGFRGLVDRCYLEFQTDIRTLQAAGIAVVFSAGNEGPNPSTSLSPANNPESFAVGAVDSSLTIANFSSRGPSACILDNDFFPEVVAPGENIKVADLTFGLPIPRFTHLDGTSFAAPHVAGGMALLRQAFPGLDPIELESALVDSAVDLGAVGPDDDYGFGMLDVLAAYRALVPCTDADADGYFAEAVCGTGQDCDDGDPDIYPGAPEIKHDGIDQDCNGFDLTIEIISAIYRPDIDELEVIATSDLRRRARPAGRRVWPHDLESASCANGSWLSRRPVGIREPLWSPEGKGRRQRRRPLALTLTATDSMVMKYAARRQTAMTVTRRSIPVRLKSNTTGSIRTATAMT